MRRPGNWHLPGTFRDVVQGGMRIARRTCMRRESAMFRLIALRTAAAVALSLSPAAALADASAAVVVADAGGLEVPAVRAIRAVTAGELRKRGVPVSEDARQEAVQPVDARLAALLQEIGVTRLFVVRIGGRLGHKVPLSLEEVSAPRLTPVAAASLTATTLDEADVVATRLVSAVLDRRSADDNAGMRTVTATEARPFQKKPGGLGGRLSAGVELFRLHGVRLLGGVDAVFPFFSTPTYLLGSPPRVRTVYPMAHLQLGF